MTFTLKGFPEEISEEIELPDMGDLLCMPIFHFNHIDYVYKHATSFQRSLLSKTDFSFDKKNIFITMNVRLLLPGQHSLINSGIWHIDSNKDKNGLDSNLYYEETDIAHILSSEGACTVFNRDEVTLDIDPEKTSRWDFIKLTNYNPAELGITEKVAPPNRIIKFTNHLHKSVPPKDIRFRFLYRAVETDGEHNFNADKKIIGLSDPITRSPLIERSNGKITISIPEENLDEARRFLSYRVPDKTTSVMISEMVWDTPKTLKLFCNTKLSHQAFSLFQEKVNNIQIFEKDSPYGFNTTIVSHSQTNRGIELILKVSENDLKRLKNGARYQPVFSNRSIYRYEFPPYLDAEYKWG